MWKKIDPDSILDFLKMDNKKYVQKKFVQNRIGKKKFFNETINFSMKKRK
jgi:hypothetical protein